MKKDGVTPVALRDEAMRRLVAQPPSPPAAHAFAASPQLAPPQPPSSMARPVLAAATAAAS
jgi:hypothetical protein